jgi:rfaE bifunctional protein kinase chain/domain
MKKTIFISGNFNILHPGHLRLLKFARELGNKLIVGVISDKLGGDLIHIPEKLRLEGISSNTWVTEALLINEPLHSVIESLKPDIVVKGKEHEGNFNPELEAVESYGGKLIFSSGEVTFSSLDLINKNLETEARDTYGLPLNYLDRHNFSSQDILNALKQISDIKVCVIGDLIVDEYISCDALGMSQEDPSIVVTPLSTKKFIGGAGIVAAHAAGLGANVDFFSVAGNDASRDFSSDHLKDYGVNSYIETDDTRPTTLKQRYRAKNKTLLRVSHLQQNSISISLQKKILDKIKKKIDSYDLMVFSDFNYGCLPQQLVDNLVQTCINQGVLMVADSQSSSQNGDVSRFKGMDLLTPTEREARVSLHNQEDGLVTLAEKLRVKSNAKNIILKLAQEGVLLHQNIDSNKAGTDRIKSFNLNPADEAGAGDSMLIAAALSYATSKNFWLAGVIGSIAAGLQISRIGNSPLSIKELSETIEKNSHEN